MFGFFKSKRLRPTVTHAGEVWVGIIILLSITALFTGFVRHVSPNASPGNWAEAGYWPTLEATDWSRVRDVASFDSDTLYAKIDGGADLYLQHGFRQLFFGRYVYQNDEQRDLQVYLYRMSDTDSARSIYQEEVPPNAESAKLGELSYRTSSSLYIQQDCWYLQILAAEEDRQEIMLMIGRNMVALLTGESS